MTSADSREVLDLIFALPVEDRRQLDRVYRQRGGQNDLRTAILESLSGRSRLMARAYLDNSSGQLEAHDALMLATSRLGNDEEAVFRILKRMTNAQMSAVNAALVERYDVTLSDVVRKLSRADRRLARLLVRSDRSNGEIADADARAFEIHEAMRGFGTDQDRLFRALEGSSSTDIPHIFGAYRRLFGKELRPRLERAFGGFFTDALSKTRLGLLLDGIKGDPTKAMMYAAVSLRLALKGRVNAPDVLRTLATVVKPEEGGQPTMRQVADEYQRQFGNRGEELRGLALEGDIGRKLSGAPYQLAMLMLRGGQQMTGPAAAAVRLGHARKGRLFGLRADPSVVREVLDRPDLSDSARAEYLDAVKREYAKRFGADDLDFTALESHVETDFGSWADAKIGVPSAARSLVQKGTLSPAERIYHAIHSKFLGFKQLGDRTTLLSEVDKLSDLDKLMLPYEYARLVHRPCDTSNGLNPLAEDLRANLRTRDFELTDQLLSLTFANHTTLVERLKAKIEADSSRRLGMWVEQTFGSPERMAEAHAQHPERMGPEIEAQVARARRNSLSSWICDLFGPEGKNVEAAARQMRRDIEIAIQLAAVSPNRDVCKPHVDRMAKTYEQLQAAIRSSMVHQEMVAERAAQVAMTVAVTTATVMTAGTASPLLLVPVAAGAVTRVLGKVAVLGGSYDLRGREVLKDAAVGAAWGGISVGIATAIPLIIDQITGAAAGGAGGGGSGGGVDIPGKPTVPPPTHPVVPPPPSHPPVLPVDPLPKPVIPVLPMPAVPAPILHPPLLPMGGGSPAVTLLAPFMPAFGCG